MASRRVLESVQATIVFSVWDALIGLFAANERLKGNIPVKASPGKLQPFDLWRGGGKTCCNASRITGLHGLVNVSSAGRWEIEMRKIGTATWMVAAFLVGLAIVVTVYAGGTPTHRLGMALRATARWSFLLFCLATYGGALSALFGPAFQPLARRGRDLGLAFAAAHSVHLALVVWLLYSSPYAIPRWYMIVFSIGVFWVYVLAAFSLSSTLSAQLGPRRWKFVRTIGVEYIAFAFAFEFTNRILDGNFANALHYSPLLAAAVGGPLLRMAARIKRRSDAENTVRLLPD